MMEVCQFCTPEEQAACLCSLPQFAFFREWMASGDAVKQMHVRNRSRLGYQAPPEPAAIADAPGAGSAPVSIRPPPDPLVGDMVAALAERIGADRAAKWVAAKLGVDCGCSARREALNRLHLLTRRFLGSAGAPRATEENRRPRTEGNEGHEEFPSGSVH